LRGVAQSSEVSYGRAIRRLWASDLCCRGASRVYRMVPRTNSTGSFVGGKHHNTRCRYQQWAIWYNGPDTPPRSNDNQTHHQRRVLRCASVHHIRLGALRRGFWTPNNAEHLFAGAANHDPVPMNRCLKYRKFGRDRVHHKVRVSRRRIVILRNYRLSAWTTFRTVENQGNARIGRHLHSMG